MTVDYDLVILGGGSAARDAALCARQLKARVALVEPSSAWVDSALFYHEWRQAIAAQQPVGDSSLWAAARLSELRARSFAIAEVLAEQQSLPVLAAAGVDVVVGEAEFYRQPQLGVRVNERSLRSRKFLIATGASALVPPIDGLHSTEFLTLDQVAQSPASLMPSGHVVIVGSEPRGLELAQLLARSGAQVTLTVHGRRLLPAEDEEVERLIQAQLEADGVQILTQTPVTLIKRLDGKRWVQAGDRALEADTIVLAVGQQPLLKSLNLEAAGVKWLRTRIPVNAKLQTTNPRIYACGEVLGGYALPHLARYEAAIAVGNALSCRSRSIDYRQVPWAIFALPELARVGLTEAQAKQRFGDRVCVLRQSYKFLPIAHIQGEPTGFCKLILHRNGKILGAHLVGAAASETIAAIALAVQQNLPIRAFAMLSPISPTGAEILQRAAIAWQQDRQPLFVQECLENWFSFRRSMWRK